MVFFYVLNILRKEVKSDMDDKSEFLLSAFSLICILQLIDVSSNANFLRVPEIMENAEGNER